jgi:hypothetical protein
MGSRLLFVFFLFCSSAVAADLASLERQVNQKKLWEHPQWINLLHYQPRTFGGFKSQADGLTFFFSPIGKTSPRAEIIATLQAFFRTPTAGELAPPPVLTDAEIQAELKKSQDSYDGKKLTSEEEKVRETLERDRITNKLTAKPMHPLCQFPARLRFLERELEWDGKGLPHVECQALDEFRRRLSATTVSVVFSSFFLNNPSSTFGHSFIRLGSGIWSNYGSGRNELLDTGINYAANMGDANPIVYSLFGMLGLFPGTFTAIPYYYKVREYNDYESRDLWSYDLSLSPDEMLMLVDHIWEQGKTYYDYFYFDENCSYHMFTLLDAAAPRLGLTKRLPFYVIPSDTIRVLYSAPDVVKKISYRPSVLSQFRYRLENLSESERIEFDRIFRSGNPESIDPLLSKESAARILDTYSDQIDLVSSKELIIDGSEAQKLKQRLLVKRASLGVRSVNLEVPPPERSAPHLAHGIGRLSLGFAGESDRGNSEVLEVRAAMHDLLDPGLGYSRNMQVDFGTIRARYLNQGNGFLERLEIDEVNLFKLTALTPINPYYSSKSVRAELGVKRVYDRDCENRDHRCLPLQIEYAPGVSFDPSGKEKYTLFAFMQGRFNFSPSYEGEDIRLGIGPRLGAIFYFSDSLRFMAHAEILGRVWAEDDFVSASEATLRWGVVPGISVDASGRHERDIKEAVARIHYYF